MDENKMTQTGERLLTVDNLKTTFMIHKTKVEAVRGASIHVDDGDILAVVGESGSGKSVLMKSIMGLLPENAQQQTVWFIWDAICWSFLQTSEEKCEAKNLP